eukprot:5522468-Pleurochrysis_carterae.AAC.3
MPLGERFAIGKALLSRCGGRSRGEGRAYRAAGPVRFFSRSCLTAGDGCDSRRTGSYIDWSELICVRWCRCFRKC